MQKNTAGKWVVFAFQDEGGANPGEPVTGDAANITANIRIDGGAANAVDDTNPTELEDGFYIFDVTAAETNGDLILICPASATANVNVIGVPGAVWTMPANFNDLSVTETTGRVDVGSIEGSDATDQINAACDTALADYNAVVPADLPTNFADLAITASTGRVTVGTNADKTGYSISGTLTTLDALDTAQEDQFSNLPASVRAEMDSNSTQLAAILTDTAVIGAAGAGLTAIPWNPSWDAEVQSEVVDALTAYSAVSTSHLPANFSDLSIILDGEESSTYGVNVASIGGQLYAYDSVYSACVDAIFDERADDVTAVLTTQMSESYAADGAAPTLTQVLMLIQQTLTEFTIAGTSKTVKRLDGSTTAAVLTLDDDTSPTGLTRSS